MQPDGVNIGYFKLRLFDLTALQFEISKVYDIWAVKIQGSGNQSLCLQFENKNIVEFEHIIKQKKQPEVKREKIITRFRSEQSQMIKLSFEKNLMTLIKK